MLKTLSKFRIADFINKECCHSSGFLDLVFQEQNRWNEISLKSLSQWVCAYLDVQSKYFPMTNDFSI